MKLLFFLCLSILLKSRRFRHEIRYTWLKMRMRRHALLELLETHAYKFDGFISCDARDAGKYVKNGILINLETKGMRQLLSVLF